MDISEQHGGHVNHNAPSWDSMDFSINLNDNEAIIAAIKEASEHFECRGIHISQDLVIQGSALHTEQPIVEGSLINIEDGSITSSNHCNWIEGATSI